jgi:N-methylhydantoinase B
MLLVRWFCDAKENKMLERNPRLMVFRHLLASVTEEMGEALRLASVSPNIKERLDFSCALLDRDGRLIAHAAHIPVHLGSAHLTIPAVRREREPLPGEILVLNDPHRGGTHLNDVTVLAPFYRGEKLLGFLLNRAHHADIGGAEPGSMSGARDLFGEGLILPPTRLCNRLEPVEDIWRLFCANVRDPESARADLQAQVAALARGARRMADLCQRFGDDEVAIAMGGLLDHGERLTRALLRRWPDRSAKAADHLDGPDTPRIVLRAEKLDDRLRLDFSRSSGQVPGSWNTHAAVATSAVFYALQALSPEEIPETSGTLRPVEVILPEASVISSEAPSGVAIGNVETSQRIVDVVLAAFRGLFGREIPAASQGTMNNVLFGGVRRDGRPFVHYETLAGGAGAGQQGDGASAVQVHMTNTRNTPIEVLEAELPVRITRLEVRRRSGGAGMHRGGDGMIKEYEFLESARVTVTGTRRFSQAEGAFGGEPGKSGCDGWIAAGKSRPERVLPGETRQAARGDRLRVETPGGGGFGRVAKNKK